jgi:hypothetical protein
LRQSFVECRCMENMWWVCWKYLEIMWERRGFDVNFKVVKKLELGPLRLLNFCFDQTLYL